MRSSPTFALRSITPAIAALAAPHALAQNDLGDQLHKLEANDPIQEAGLGLSVGISGNRVIAGSAGISAAYVFDAITGEQLHKFQGDDSFGIAVDVSGTTAIIADPFSNDHDTGVAYIFDLETFEQTTTLLPIGGTPNGNMGWSVAISGFKAVAGSNNTDGAKPLSGAAFLFNAQTGAQIAKLVAQDPDADEVGFGVDIDGNFAIVGAPGFGSPGSAYLFEATGGTQLHKLVADDGQDNDRFGESVAIHGAFAVVGAPKHDTGRGAAYVYSIAGQQITKLVAEDAEIGDLFGESVGLFGNVAVVGAEDNDGPGKAYLFDIFTGEQLAKLTADDGANFERFGAAADIDGPTAVVGAYRHDGAALESGAAYLYRAGDADSDGDGLLDAWETDGIPYLGVDGQLEHYVLPGADPMHKNLYVELDHLAGLTFSPDVVDAVEFAFFAAPVPNPDGFDGIDLHIIVDEGDLPFEATTPTPNNDFPPDSATLKFERFGTKDERADPDRFALLAAKALAYRYCVMYNEASGDVGGLAELGGDDLAIFCGTYADTDKAAVFMHELGHNLNLRHGGGDSINGKPNYPSIMNYVLAYKEPWNQTFWQLDYSRAELAAIEEDHLSELDSVGVGGGGAYDDFFMPFYGIVADGAPCYDPSLFGQPIVSYADLDPAVLTDLNLDCDTDDDEFAGDLNFLDDSGLPGSVTPSPGEVLHGYNDWANVVLPVSDGGGAFAGTVPTDELTNEQRDVIRETFPPPPAACAADVNGDGQLSILDFVAFQYAWQDQDPIADCTNDDTFNILDFVCYQQLFTKGCD